MTNNSWFYSHYLTHVFTVKIKHVCQYIMSDKNLKSRSNECDEFFLASGLG